MLTIIRNYQGGHAFVEVLEKIHILKAFESAWKQFWSMKVLEFINFELL